MWRRRFNVFARSAFLFSVMIGGISQSPMVLGAEPKPAETFGSMKSVLLGRHKAGPELTALLANEQAPLPARFLAAKRLASLEYARAIPILIRHIDLESPYLSVVRFPVVEALRDYGMDAVPDLAHAYVNHKSDGSPEAEKLEFLYRASLPEKKEGDPLWEATRTYLIGMAMETTDAEKRRKINEILTNRGNSTRNPEK